MNREEAVIYLMRNPMGKLKMKKDNLGRNVSYYIEIERITGAILIDNNRTMGIYFETDKSEFEIVRVLKKMSFVDAVKLITNTNLNMIPLNGHDIKYNDNDKLFEFTDDIDGLWTVEGIYEPHKEEL